MNTTIILADVLGCEFVYSNKGIYYKKINNKWIGKQAIQCINNDGTTYIDWYEDCDKNKIDKRYYNLDGSKK